MVASRYCERADLYTYGGLPLGSLPNPARVVAAIDVTTNTLQLDGHGLADDQVVTFRAEAGGSLPAGLVAGTTYFAIPLTDHTFRVTAAAGGAAVDLSGAYSRVVCVAELPIDQAIEFASAVIDNALIAHGVPLEAPYDVIIITTCAELAVAKILPAAGQGPGVLGGAIEAAQKRIAQWVKGVPVRGALPPATHTNLAVIGSRGSSDWIPSDGSIL